MCHGVLNAVKRWCHNRLISLHYLDTYIKKRVINVAVLSATYDT